MNGALDGIRVIDLSHVLAGPTATMILADLRADVIHIEPSQGDDAREYGPFLGKIDKDHSGYFISLNRNRKRASFVWCFRPGNKEINTQDERL